MKTIFNIITPLLIISLFYFSGCQQEVTEIIDPPAGEVFTPVSPIADLVQRTSLKDGSYDNIIDGSSCSSLVLPVTVVVNGMKITLDSIDDFYRIEHIVDKFDDDDDQIKIIFPVTVILSDYSELVITNEDDFEDLIDQCTEDGDDDDIECVDFKFPLSISIYDSDNQLSDVVTFDNDKELYKFIHDLKNTDFASFNYPITVVLSDSSEMVIKDNNELEDILKNAIDACDEDDDNDHDEDDVDNSELVKVIIDGNWIISYFFNDNDSINDFAGYVFTFFEDGSAEAKKGMSIIKGNWYGNGDDGKLKLELDFGEKSPFDELQEDWVLIEFDGTIIKLMDKSGEHDSESYLTFVRPTGDEGGDEAPAIAKVMVDGLWIVANYIDSGDDETARFNGFELDFSADSTVTATKSDDVLPGNWSTIIDDGVDKLVLDFGEHMPFNKLNDDWDIVDVKDARIELKDVSGGDGTVDKLVLEKKQ